MTKIQRRKSFRQKLKLDVIIAEIGFIYFNFNEKQFWAKWILCHIEKLYYNKIIVGFEHKCIVMYRFLVIGHSSSSESYRIIENMKTFSTWSSFKKPVLINQLKLWSMFKEDVARRVTQHFAMWKSKSYERIFLHCCLYWRFCSIR